MKKIIKKILIKLLGKNSQLLKYVSSRIIWTYKKKEFKKYTDYEYAINHYKERTGKTLNLLNPQTFDEKLWYLKINYREPSLKICSDKLKVRDYIKDLGLSHILNELIAVYKSADDINFNNFKEKVFIKCNHVSGTNILWDPEKKINTFFLKKRFNYILKQNYYYASREWNYNNIPPRIVVEKVIEKDKNGKLMDYRFFCFSGKCDYVAVDIDTANDLGEHSGIAKRNIYDRDFNLLKYRISRDGFTDPVLEKPINYATMLSYAETISSNFPMVRVDLYNIDGKIIFGEMTFYHQGGVNFIEPQKFDYELGSKIRIDNI